MKRLLAFMLILTVAFTIFAGCEEKPPETPSTSCITIENGKYFLTLPKSQQKIELDDDEIGFAPYITDQLVEAAESKINEDIAQYTNNSRFYLDVSLDNYLYLSTEVIVSIDDPSESTGVCLDHKHLFFSEKISTSAVEPSTPLYSAENIVARYFKSYLDYDINFDGLTQSEFIDKIEEYRYNGESVMGAVQTALYDGASGGGWLASGDLFTFYYDYNVSADGKRANVTKALYTSVALEDLILPYGVKFGDSLASVFNTFDIDFRPYRNLKPDRYSVTDLTIYDDGTLSLRFKVIQDAVGVEFPYEFVFTEKYDNDQHVSVKRTVILSFDKSEQKALSKLSVLVDDTEPIR
ncbi:MAG: hypothetical protein IKU25_08270 [Clostridia bacterium]|nr:hypothetical protein [Clostridia bacterium]